MTMLEKMARAFAAAGHADSDSGGWVGGDHVVLEVDDSIDVPAALRAALLAIRNDPSEPALDAIAGTRFATLPPGKQQAERRAWAAAIDAILNVDAAGGYRP